MQKLRLNSIHADDVQDEVQQAIAQLESLKTVYAKQLDIVVQDITADTLDVLIILVWNQSTPEFEEQVNRLLEQNASKVLLFKKNAAVPVDLTNRELLIKRLEEKERLELFISTNLSNLDPISFNSTEDFVVRFEEQLEHIISQRLGTSTKPISFRPQLGSTYLERPRLLELLPDSSGYVVCLEAPYGYGKSVLAAQWADQLELDNWRIVWLSQTAQVTDLKPSLALALGISAETPSEILYEKLSETQSLVVIEDLSSEINLDFLLQELNAIVLLASREPIEHTVLDSLKTEDRVIYLTATELAFTLKETEQLIGDVSAAQALHHQTLGWSLPLHVSFLTGSSPDPAALLAGLKASLEAELWQEMLLLTALPYLPQGSSNSYTDSLVNKGFVQLLENSFRLHPYLSEIIFNKELDQVNKTLMLHEERLPLLLLGEGYVRCKNWPKLATVLANTDAELWRQAPQQLVEWSSLIGEIKDEINSANIQWTIGAAYSKLNDMEAAVEYLEKALESPEISPQQRLGIIRDLLLPLGIINNEKAQNMLAIIEPLLDQVDTVLAGRVLANRALVHVFANQFEKAIEAAEEALNYYPADNNYRVGSETNLALFRWNLYGDFDYRLNTQINLLEKVWQMYPVQALGQCRDIAAMHLWMGDKVQARAYFKRAAKGESVNPAIALEAKAALAYLDNDQETLNTLCETANLFSGDYLTDVVPMYKILADLAQNNLKPAAVTYAKSAKGLFSSTAYARVLALEGKTDEAIQLLDTFDEEIDVGNKVYLDAAMYFVKQDEASLETFLRRTTAGSRLLPGFIPLSILPKRTELVEHYSITEILDSGWQEAIEYRINDVPELQLKFLGQLEASLFTEKLELTDRQKQILTLLSLGFSREQIAETMWPEVETKKQRNNLNVQLNTLRKVIEPWGVTTYLHEDGLQKVTSDYSDLQHALETGNSTKVIDLYQEPFAPGLSLEPIIEERQRLREAVIDVLLTASASATTSTGTTTTQDASEARRYLLKVTELDPLNEEALQKLLELLVRQGRRREAKQRYTQFATQLKDDMGLEPLETTSQLIQA